MGLWPTLASANPQKDTAAKALCQGCGSDALKSQGLSDVAKAISSKASSKSPPAKKEPLYIPPVDPSHGFVTSPSYIKRKDPVTGAFTRIHTGLDIGSVLDKAPIRAARSGVVIRATMNCSNNPKNSAQRTCGGGWGNQIHIQHEDGSIAIYGHLDSRCKIKPKEGEQIAQGTDLGCMGKSGRATGVHLCFNIRSKTNGRYINSGAAMGHHYRAYLKKWDKKFYAKLALMGEANEVAN